MWLFCFKQYVLELKEANVLERLHAIQLLEKSKQDFEKERDELENDINKRIIKNEANKISEAKTKVQIW